LKLDQAQFRELEAFAKFGSDLDMATQRIIDRGRKNQIILKQGLHQPMKVEEQIAILYASTNGYLDSVPLAQVKEFETSYLSILKTQHSDLLAKLATGAWTEDMAQVLAEEAKNLAKLYTPVPSSHK
jgi:F-type H+/Na+-transporting ATPase subunit alpha